ncbi:MAG: hypothetical protein LPK25_13830 [Cyclobacteriaceae bacterium]|nr:hypothetical protein [Cyclobacteriaceae bacterium]
MNTTTDSTAEIMDFEIAYQERYCRVRIHPGNKIVICELLADYIPIEDFKVAFGKIGEIVKQGDYQKFIFDKRSLRAFHQPTMEWYFLEWKKEMLNYGLSQHRKILPSEKWFEKMVQIAKEQILKNNPDHIIDQLDILYCDSIEEAIIK